MGSNNETEQNGSHQINAKPIAKPIEKNFGKEGLSTNKKMFLNMSTGKFDHLYTVGDVIGKGQFGEIRVAIHIPTQKRRALKIIYKKSFDNFASTRADLLSEYNALRKLDHRNIIKIYECFEDLYNIYLFMELLEGGNLFERIIIIKRAYSENEVKAIIKQILLALAHCNSCGIAHRDIKLENVMYITQDTNSEIKLVDFGLSNKIKNLTKVQTLVGSPLYMAPEVLEGIPGGFLSDIYSLGILQYFLLRGKFPFNQARNFTELKELVLNNRFNSESFKEFPGISKNCKSIMLQMLNHDYNMRPRAEDLLKHPWFTSEPSESELSELNHNQQEIYQNICAFKNLDIMQKSLLQFISYNCDNKEETKKISEVFKSWDKSGEGTLSKKELKEGMSNLPYMQITHEEFENIFNSIDTNHDNKIQYSEFLAAASNLHFKPDSATLRGVFDFLDKNHDGTISSAELSSLFKGNIGLKPIKLQELVFKYDQDCNNSISFPEFEKIIYSSFQGSN